MAIIPRADESQVISAGSPVPISGTGEARLQYGAFEDLGSAIMRYGSQLSQIEQANNNEKDKIEADIAGSDFQLELLKLERELKKDPNVIKMDPSKALDMYKERATKLASSYASKLDDTRNKRAYFLKDANALIANNGTKFYMGAVKDIASVTEARLNEYISKRAAVISETIPDDLGPEIKALKEKIKGYDTFTEDEKILLFANARKELAKGYINAHILKIDQATTQNERDMWEKKGLESLQRKFTTGQVVAPSGQIVQVEDAYEKATGPGLLSPDEMNKYRDEIVTAKYKADNRALALDQKLEVADARNTRTRLANNARKFGALALTIPDESVEDFNKRLFQEAAIGNLDPRVVDDIINLRQKVSYTAGPIVTEADLQYRTQFVDQLIDADNAEAYVTKPMEDKADISFNEKYTLVEKANTLVSAFNKEPGLKQKLKQSAQSFEQYKTDPTYKYLTHGSKLAVEEAARKAKQNLYTQALDNPTIDVEKVAKDIYKNTVQPQMNFQQSISPKLTLDITELQQMKEKLKQDYIREEEKGTLTPAKEKEYQNKYRTIDNNIRNLIGNK